MWTSIPTGKPKKDRLKYVSMKFENSSGANGWKVLLLPRKAGEAGGVRKKREEAPGIKVAGERY